MNFKMYKDRYRMPDGRTVYGPVVEIGNRRYLGRAAQETGVALILVSHIVIISLFVGLYKLFF